MVNRHDDVPSNHTPSNIRRGKKVKSYLQRGSPSDKQKSEKRRNFIKGSLMALLGSAENTSSPATVDSKSDETNHIETLPLNSKSLRHETDNGHYPAVHPASDTKTKTKRANIFHTMFKSPISSRQKHKIIERKKIPEAHIEKEKETKSNTLASTLLLVPDLEDTMTTTTSSSDHNSHRSKPSETISGRKYLKSMGSAQSRESEKRRVNRKKEESQVPNTERSIGPICKPTETEGRHNINSADGCIGDKVTSLRDTFDRFEDVEWGHLEFGEVGIDSVDRLKMLQDRKARRRASFGGQPTYVNFDAKPTPVVEIGSHPPKVCRRLSCGPLTSNRSKLGDTDRPSVPAPLHMNPKKAPSVRKWSSRRRDKSH